MKNTSPKKKNTSISQIQKRILKTDSLLVDFFGVPKQNPNPQPALEVLIGTILSQNTNDKNSFRAFVHLKQHYNSWKEVSALTQRALEKEIKVAGLANQKAKAIKRILTFVEERGEYSMEFLREMDEREALTLMTSFDGVGVKTASCVLLFSMKRNVCPVDTHVNRTLNRIGVANSQNPEKTFWFLYDILPDGIAHRFHTNLIRLGREFCIPTNPACSICPVKRVCKYEKKNPDREVKRRYNDFLLLDNLQ
ncbi:MAG: hypothetical protein AMXMBFR48_05260 [Ignavibacteriales bacterium]